jgi:hypothetical protein
MTLKSQRAYALEVDGAKRKVMLWTDEQKSEYKRLYLLHVTFQSIAHQLRVNMLQARHAWNVLGMQERELNEIYKKAAKKRHSLNASPKTEKRRMSEMVVTLEASSKGDMHNRIEAALRGRYRVTRERITLDGREVGLYDAIREANRVNKANGWPLIDDNPAWVEGL